MHCVLWTPLRINIVECAGAGIRRSSFSSLDEFLSLTPSSEGDLASWGARTVRTVSPRPAGDKTVETAEGGGAGAIHIQLK